MKKEYSENSFKEWLMLHKSLSKKASGDVVSRLKRCMNIESLDHYKSTSEYYEAILRNPIIDKIPISSRKSMSRAIRLYFEFYESC